VQSVSKQLEWCCRNCLMHALFPSIDNLFLQGYTKAPAREIVSTTIGQKFKIEAIVDTRNPGSRIEQGIAKLTLSLIMVLIKEYAICGRR